MKSHTFAGVVPAAPSRERGNLRKVHGIQQCEESTLLPLTLKLLSNLKCNQSAATVSADQIGSWALSAPDALHIRGSHIFNSCQWRISAVQALRLQSVERLIRA